MTKMCRSSELPSLIGQFRRPVAGEQSGSQIHGLEREANSLKSRSGAGRVTGLRLKARVTTKAEMV